MNQKNGVLIVIATGGTAGHLIPGVSVAQELVIRGCAVHFIVPEHDRFISLLQKKNFGFSTITVKGWNRRFSLTILYIVFLLVRSLFKSAALLKKLQPSYVVGLGGYASLPVVIAAYVRRIPIIMHEQNMTPGLANKLIAPFARHIAISFEDSKEYFKSDRVRYTGNPVRDDLFLRDQKAARKKIGLEPHAAVVLIFGGSQGARTINRIILEAIPLIRAQRGKKLISFIHITGRHDGSDVKLAYQHNNFTAQVEEFSFDMGLLYSAADLAVCRAGASTISELIHTETPAILIPFPHATDDHQMKNARYLKNKGCVEIIPESALSGETLARTIMRIVQDSDCLRTMKNNYQPLIRQTTGAAERLADLILT